MGKAPKQRSAASTATRQTTTAAATGVKMGSGSSAATKTAVFTMNTGIGQHILKNPLVAQGIVDKANINPSDIVLEVGPGTGNLTVRILEKARKLYAVEMDPRMASEVTKRVQGHADWQKKLDIVLGDVIKADLPYHDICISNTPYQISSPLVFKLLTMPKPPRVAILMFQREFALRLLARPGDALYCRLSVNAQMWSRITHIMKVGRNNFRPPPNVESSVVRIEIKNPRPDIGFDEWDGMLRICFVRKNRTIAAGFKSPTVMGILEKNYSQFMALNKENNNNNNNDDDDDSMDIDSNNNNSKLRAKERSKEIEKVVKEKVETVLNTTGLGEKRAGKCTEKDFLTLLHAFHQVGIHFA